MTLSVQSISMALPISAVIESFDGVTRTVVARAVNSSELASLGGKKAKTPIIAGSICGGIMLLAWAIGFIIYFRKRYNRKKRNRLVAAGKATPRAKDLEAVKEKIVIPPDPAVLLGKAKPGEQLFPERQNSKESHHHRPHTSRHGTYTKKPPNALEENVTPQTTSQRISEHPEDDIVEKMKVPPNV